MSDSLNNPRNEDLNGRQEGFPQAPGHEGQGGFPNAPQGDMNHQGGQFGGQPGYGQGGFGAPEAGMDNAGGTPENLDLPLYGASMGQAITRFFKRYAKFSGRSSRSEYWWWQLFSILVSFVLGLVQSLFGGPSDNMNGLGNTIQVISFIFGLAVLLPTIALTVRRLHDTNKSGLFALFFILPFIGPLVLLIMCIFASNPLGRRFDDANAPGVNNQFAGHNGAAY